MTTRALATWGHAAQGRLGLEQGVSIPTVCQALLGESLTAVLCGGAHTCAVTGVCQP